MKERLHLFQSLIIYLPSVFDMYKLSGIDSTFHHETVELAHTHLDLLRTAIELDGKPIPETFVDGRPVIFRIGELTLTPWNPPYDDPNRFRVPRNGSFGVVGAHAAVTLAVLLPWLGDRTVIPDSERLDASRYLNEDLPVIWQHIVPATRRSLSEQLDSVIEGTRQPQVREGLLKLKNQLQPATDKSALRN